MDQDVQADCFVPFAVMTNALFLVGVMIVLPFVAPFRTAWSCVTVVAKGEAIYVRVAKRIVEDVGVAVPGLRDGRINRGEASGVGRKAANLRGVRAVEEIVVAGNGVRILAGEGKVGSAGRGVGFAEGRVRHSGKNGACRRGG